MTLKDEIEILKWQTLDEMGRKQQEIDYLREALRSQQQLSEENIECQRRDLTESYEKILSEREKTYLEREREMLRRVDMLEAVFHQIKSDNDRMKAELLETGRRRDQVETDLISKDEIIRKLRWQLEDGRMQRLHSEDELKRALQSAETALEQQKNVVTAIKSEHSTAFLEVIVASI